MLTIRPAILSDLNFLVQVDLDEEGYTSSPTQPTLSLPPMGPRSVPEAEGQGMRKNTHKPIPHEIATHRQKIAGFVTDPAQAAWVVEGDSTSHLVGAGLCRFRDRLHEEKSAANEFLFRHLSEDWLPADGRFCEVFNLWIDPAYRRRGLATTLKRQMEKEALRRGITMMYTHTEERNTHVLELNRKLGYREIRRGPLWDDVIRVSLVKELRAWHK
jgi:ribosomal protein S18 acetylase RimI-like enzyme